MSPAPQSKQLEFAVVDPSGKRAKAEPKPRRLSAESSRVRQYALDLAKRERHHHFTAVSVEFIQRIDAKLQNLIQVEIKRHPSRGKRLA